MAILSAGFSLACAVAVVGCYSPRVRDCALSCATDSDCVNGQRCGVAGLCASPAFMDSCDGSALAPDAADDSDAAAHHSDGAAHHSDASAHDTSAHDTSAHDTSAHDTSEQSDCDSSACGGAGGTCAGDTCVIVGGMGPGPVTCPAGETCAITCSSDMSCNSGVDCSAALSCHIACVGDHSCGHDVVSCGGTGCVLECVGDHSCAGLSIACTGTACIYDFGGPGCGAHSCQSMGQIGPGRCSCDGAGCATGDSCP